MLEDLGLNALKSEGVDASKFESVYLDEKGEERTELNLNQEMTLTLISGYSVAMRHKIVKRWLELEAEKYKHSLIPKLATDPTYDQVWRLALQTAQTQLMGVGARKFRSILQARWEELHDRIMPEGQALDFSQLEFYLMNAAKLYDLEGNAAKHMVRAAMEARSMKQTGGLL